MKKFLSIMCMFFGCLALVCATGGQEEGAQSEQTTVEESTKAEVFRTDLHVFSTPAEYQSATGNRISSYNEAPDLKQKVADGTLPPVEQRLPDEPMVIKPVEAIGKYGGTLYQAGLGPSSFYDFEWAGVEEYIGQYDNKASMFLPALGKSWEFSADKKVVTLHLREGHKWSDGEPFTTDDIMFWWEDVALNKEINPNTPTTYTFGDELARFFPHGLP